MITQSTIRMGKILFVVCDLFYLGAAVLLVVCRAMWYQETR